MIILIIVIITDSVRRSVKGSYAAKVFQTARRDLFGAGKHENTSHGGVDIRAGSGGRSVHKPWHGVP